MALNATQRLTIVFGWHPISPGTNTSITLNAANTWLAFSFIMPRGSTTLSTVRCFVNSKSGSPVAANATCDLFSDTAAGIPNASLESKAASANPAATTWLEFTGFTTSLTAGTRYWLIFKNANATPATNNWVVNFASASQIQSVPSGTQTTTLGWGWQKLQTADGGSTWAGAVLEAPYVRLGYGDGTYDGSPIQSTAQTTAATSVFDKREVGVVFTVPQWLRANIRGVAMPVIKTGTPSGSLRYRVYKGVVLQATSYTIPVGNVSTSTSWIEQWFSADVPIVGGDTIRVVASEDTAGDTNTKNYGLFSYVWDSDSNSTSLKPIDGTLSRTETADATASPVVFSDTATAIMPFALLLDTSLEYNPSGIFQLNE